MAAFPQQGTGRIVIEQGRLRELHRYRKTGNAAVAESEWIQENVEEEKKP